MEIRKFSILRDEYEVKYDLNSRSIVAKIEDEPIPDLLKKIHEFKTAALTILDLLEDKSSFVVTAVEFFTTDGIDGIKVSVNRTMNNGYSHAITSPVAYMTTEEDKVTLPPNTEVLINETKKLIVDYVNGATAQGELFD
jgi:hypothetical protein